MCATTKLNLEDIRLNCMSQSQKNTYLVTPPTPRIAKLHRRLE